MCCTDESDKRRSFRGTCIFVKHWAPESGVIRVMSETTKEQSQLVTIYGASSLSFR